MTLAAAWLDDTKSKVPAVQVAFWLLVWLIEEDAVALVDGGFEVGLYFDDLLESCKGKCIFYTSDQQFGYSNGYRML